MKTKNEYSKVIFGMLGNEIDNSFASETQNDIDMKNMIYFCLSNLLLVAIFLLCSCTRNEENTHVQAVSAQTTEIRIIIADSASKTGSQRNDTSISRTKMSKKSTDELIHWAEYSTLNGN